MSRRAVNDGDHDWLVERFIERRAFDPASADFAYASGRIDEYCAQNAITAEQRETAIREAERGAWV